MCFEVALLQLRAARPSEFLEIDSLARASCLYFLAKIVLAKIQNIGAG
jgi:hypothetical protein